MFNPAKVMHNVFTDVVSKPTMQLLN